MHHSQISTLVHLSNLQNDLVRRLREVVDALADQDVEVNMPDYPGLGSLAAVLVTDRYLDHKDKEVRLHAVLACMEIFELLKCQDLFHYCGVVVIASLQPKDVIKLI